VGSIIGGLFRDWRGDCWLLKEGLFDGMYGVNLSLYSYVLCCPVHALDQGWAIVLARGHFVEAEVDGGPHLLK
jgi:hypothetical protein